MTKVKKQNKSKPKNKVKSALPTTKLTWLPKKTFELEFTVSWQKIKKTHDETLKQIAQKTEIKGFRKGKAPLDLVEKNIKKSELYQEVLRKILPETYEVAVKQHHLKPVISPKIQPLSTPEGKNWQFKAQACEGPEVKLGEYKKVVKGALAKEKIWVPGKDKKPGKDASQSYDQKIKIVTQTLLETAQVEISDLLIEDELNRILTRLLDQVNRLGMTIDQYLSSKGMSQEQLRNNYRQQAEESLKLEFILQAIIQEQKVNITETEVDKMIQAAPDKKIREKLKTPLQKAYIKVILAKRKALDSLINL